MVSDTACRGRICSGIFLSRAGTVQCEVQLTLLQALWPPTLEGSPRPLSCPRGKWCKDEGIVGRPFSRPVICACKDHDDRKMVNIPLMNKSRSG